MELKNNLSCLKRATVSILKNAVTVPIDRLSNDDSVRIIDCRKILLTYREGDTVRLLIGSGITKRNKLFSVTDENLDNDLSNDPVKYIPIEGNKYEAACNLPVTCVRKLALLSANSQDTICFRITPIGRDDWRRFQTTEEIANYNEKVITVLMQDYYLSGFYEHQGKQYELRAALPPEGYILYDKQITNPYKRDVTLEVFEVGGPQDSVLFRKSIGMIERGQADSALFYTCDHHYLRFDSIDLPHNRVVITLRDTPTQQKRKINLSNTMAWHIGSNVERRVLPSNRPTILHFSGSWCKPCQLALPDLKKLHKKYKDRYSFVTLLVEKDLPTAKTVYKKEQLLWSSFYEKLSCKDIQCLQQQLGVNIFPTYCIINEKGDVVKQVNSVEELEMALKSESL